MEDYKSYWVNYVNFSGRSTRKEFWLPVLFNFVISGILLYISGTLSGIFGLVTLIPSLANVFRRLHDTNRSGSWILICLIPIVGWIIYLVLLCSASVDEGNMYN